MKALKYLFLTTIKNSIKDLKRNPAKLIAVIFFIATIALVVVSTFLGDDSIPQNIRNINELYTIVFVLYMFIFVMMSYKGLSSGASFYSMADVNILFATPISSKKILLYGLIKQMGTSLWVGFFLIYQYAWLNTTYNLSFSGLILILLGYCIVVFCSQLTAMAIYSFSSNNEKLYKLFKFLIIGLNVIIVSYVFYNTIIISQPTVNCLVLVINSTWLNFIPVAGWTKMFVIGALIMNYHYLILGLTLNILYIYIIVYIISKTNSDFYEDVLKATEVSFNAITAKKEGNVYEGTKNVKVGKVGINKGKGANVFFYKHLLENRRSGIFLLDKNSLIFLAICILYAFITRSMRSILTVFMFTTYMQIFSIATSRWVRELTKPYIYMIPINPFIKLMMISKENILKIVIESIILFVAIGIILNSSIFEIMSCILARIGFGILFMSGNILTQRILGTLNSRTFILFLYFIIMVLLALPGVVMGIIVSATYGLSQVFIGLLITFVWNILISSIVIFFCRDILNYAELNNK